MLQDTHDELPVKMSLSLDMRMEDPSLSNPKMFETEVIDDVARAAAVPTTCIKVLFTYCLYYIILYYIVYVYV